MKEWRAFMKKYYPDGNLIDNSNVYGYAVAQTLVQVLKQCGDDLTRENVMKQAASLKDFAAPHAAAGHQDQHQRRGLRADRAVQLMKFDGKTWVRVRRGDRRRVQLADTGDARASPARVSAW